jgi:hypothetical protein
MFKRFSYIFAYLLLALMPLQSIAAANMLVCNSMMQANDSKLQQSMPCHEQMLDSAKTDDHQAQTSIQTKTPHSTDTHKSTCSTLCSTLCAVSVLADNINTTITTNTSPLAGLAEQSYASVTLPNTQRPPIFLS